MNDFLARLLPLVALAALLRPVGGGGPAFGDSPCAIAGAERDFRETFCANGPQLLTATATTLREALEALALAAFGGVALALLFAWSPWLEKTFLPLAIALQVTPLIAIAPLLLIYL